METTERQTGVAYGYLVAGQGLWAQAEPTAYRPYARSLCDTKASRQLQLRHSASDMPLPPKTEK